MKFSQRTKEQVTIRSRGYCEYCGQRVAFPQYHHRRARAMGGSKDPLTGSPANCLFVHPNCHGVIESQREVAYQNGWLVHNWDDPRDVPVRVVDQWFRFGVDGRKVLLPNLTPVSEPGEDSQSDSPSGVDAPTPTPSPGTPQSSPLHQG
jgi:5-methylcytosine-specific restriction protein A